MPTIYVNPYTVLGLQHKAGLDSVIACLRGGSSSSSSGIIPLPAPKVSIEQIIACTVNYISPIYGTNLGSIELLELNLVIADSINGYINANSGGYMNYNKKQEEFIFQILEGIKNVPYESYKDYLVNIEENVTTSGLDSNGQASLLMATAIGKADTDYWVSKVDDPGMWDVFVGDNGTEFNLNDPRVNLAAWVTAAMEGALLGATTTSRRSSVLSSASSIGTDAVSALTASIGLVTTKITLKVLPRVAEVK